MNCLVIGYGSIGSRHATVLADTFDNIFLVCQREVKGFDVFPDIRSAVESRPVHYTVISNKTSDHYSAFMALVQSGYEGPILIEKPLFEKMYPFRVPGNPVFVGYHLRFHPIIEKIRQIALNNRLYSMHVYCGQYLPDWRPGDYRDCYSARKSQGGGVLMDLSHELDYINWITGGWSGVAAMGGQVSQLEIDSEDLFGMLLETENCPLVSCQVNYLDLDARREIILNGENLALKADLISGTLVINGETSRYEIDRNELYKAQHLAAMGNNNDSICNLEQGVAVMELIEAVQEAAKRKTWINRN